jgi:shikimate kinase
MTARAVFLVGFMASGKSSVGRELAQRLGWDFLDLDERIEVREQKTIPEIFRERGEAGFRLAEANALRDLMAESLRGDSVVALSGGAFVQEDNRGMLRRWPLGFFGNVRIRALAAKLGRWDRKAVARKCGGICQAVR